MKPAPGSQRRMASRPVWCLSLTGNLVLAFGLVSAGVAWFIFGSRVPGREPPQVAIAGLDPAVARLIQEAVGEVRASPKDAAAWGTLGSVLLLYEFAQESQFALERAAKLAPADPRWPYLLGLLLTTRDAPAAIKELAHAVERCPGRPDAPRLRLAQFLAERGRNKEAEAQFEVLARALPRHPVALLGQARLRFGEGRYSEATNLLSGILSDAHTAKSASALLAVSLQALNDVAGARTAARLSASAGSDVAWPDPFLDETLIYRVGRKAWLEQAASLLDQTNASAAMELLARVTREYPEDDEAWYLRGWALNQAQQPEAAEQALREHLQRSPQSPKGQAQLAVALLQQKRYLDALGVLQTAVRLKPTWRELHSNLGYACVQLGRADEASAHFREALAVDPNYLPTFIALAELALRRGDRAEARRFLQQAAALDAADPRLQIMARRLSEP